MGRLSVAIALALLLFGAAAPAWAQTADDASNDKAPAATAKWGAHIDLQGKLGNRRDLGIGDLFLPVAQNADTLLFGDIRARFDDRDNREGNFGLGVRHMLASGWNLGGYAYFDRNRTTLGNDFNQITVGAEALSLDWDARANVYETVGPGTKDLGGAGSSSTASLSGTTVQVTTVDNESQEKALSGFDAEIGWRVPLFAADAGRQLRVYLGGYRFAAADVRSVEGPRGRLDFTVDTVPFLWAGSRLDLGAEVQHDGPRGTQEFASLTLRIPLEIFAAASPRSLTAQERRMTDPVVRDVDIVSGTRTVGGPSVTETATETADGSTITVLDSGTTSDLPTAVTSAGANSTVILTGTFNTTATTTLQSGQTVMGSGSVTVKTPSGHTATLTTSAATISNTAATATPAVTMAANSTLTGLTIDQSSGTNPATGVQVNGANGAAIKNDTISVTGGSTSHEAVGINSSGNSSNVTISGNTVTAENPTVGSGIAFAIIEANSTVTVSGNTLTATGNSSATALQLSNGTTNGTATVTNNTLTASGTGTTIALKITGSTVVQATVTVTGNTLSASGGTTNHHTKLDTAFVNAGSTGNTLAATNTGDCATNISGSGQIEYTNAAACTGN